MMTSEKLSENILWVKCEIVSYLDEKCDFWKNVELEVKKFAQNIKTSAHCRFPLHIPLEVHYSELMDKAEFLAEWLCKEPITVQKLFHHVVHVAITINMRGLSLEVQPGQLHCTVKVIGWNPHLNTRGILRNITAQYTGLIVKCNYIKQTAWSCYEECSENTFILPCNPMKAPICGNCNELMVEKQAGRDLGTKALVQFLENYSTKNSSHVTFAKHIWTFDEILDNLIFGQSYSVTYIKHNKNLIAWNVEKIPLITPLMREISVLKKWKTFEDYCPWTITFVLSRSIGAECQLSHQHLKLGLLLSIASIQENDTSPPLSVVAAGNEIDHVQNIMKEASKFVNRKGYGQVITLSEGDGKDYEMQAGPLSMAKNGVCMLGNWAQHIKTSRGSSILSAISSGKINLENGESSPLKCCIWTYWNDVYSTKKKSEELKTSLNNLFGIIFPAAHDENDETMADYILGKALHLSSPYERDEALPTDAEIKELFFDISNWKVTMEPTAESLLREYFLTIRKDKPDQVPLRALSVLEKMTKANARLSQRCIATKEDVLMAAYLYQISLLTLFQDFELPRFQPVTVTSLQDIRDNMVNFGKWLKTYINTFLH